jgi:hypothetical protein
MASFQWGKIIVNPGGVKIFSMILTPLIYSIAEGIAFGVLFYAIYLTSALNMQDIIGVFAISAAMFIFSGLIGSLFSIKTTFTIGKILLIASLSYLFILPIFVLIVMFNPIFINQPLVLAVYSIMGFIMLLYIMYDFSVITKINQFAMIVSNKEQIMYSLMFGFKLLIDFVGLVMVMLRIFIAFKK